MGSHRGVDARGVAKWRTALNLQRFIPCVHLIGPPWQTAMTPTRIRLLLSLGITTICYVPNHSTIPNNPHAPSVSALNLPAIFALMVIVLLEILNAKCPIPTRMTDLP